MAAMSERNRRYHSSSCQVDYSHNPDAKNWRCPNCGHDESEADEEEFEHDTQLNTEANERPVSQQSNISTQDPAVSFESSGAASPSLADGSTTSSRPRRKRKTSPAETDDTGLSLRKRRKSTLLHSNEDGTDRGTSTEPSGSRSARALRLKVSRSSSVNVEKKSRTAMVLKFRVQPDSLKNVLGRKKREKRRSTLGGPSRAARATPGRMSVTPAPPQMIETPFTADSYSQPFYSLFDKDDGTKSTPYGGILDEAQADTSKTLPMPDDRRRFDQAKQKAEDEWRARVLMMQAEAAEAPVRKPRKTTHHHASQIECIEFGGWEIDTWYAAPYPAEYSRNRVLYICEFCLNYMNSDYVAWRHKLKCPAKHPPGDEIYRHGSVSVFEVDGRKNPVYCQNLCLLAKLFLGSKTLYYDVEPFLFYILCEFNECGYHFVGYFSKEKRPSSQYNVSCILTLPIHQRKGYGNLLIDFSYLLTKTELKTGSPEKPLSDMGLVSYRNYWRLILCKYFLAKMGGNKHKNEGLSIKKISDDTGMTADDVIAALEALRALVRDPQTKLYAFRVDLDYCREYVDKWEAKGYVKLKPEALAWTPYVMGRNNLANFELGPISTIAPREDDEAKVQEGPLSVGAATNPIVNGITGTLPDDPDSVAPDVVNGNQQNAQSGQHVWGVDNKENTVPSAPGDSQMQNAEDPQAWKTLYKAIPPSRFEVFPHIGAGRRAGGARLNGGGRPAAVRTSSVMLPKRPSGPSVRRATNPKVRVSSGRKKSGGTGRGPGRWPKGTKKSDYGNADSGPGLPPGWKDKQAKLKETMEAKKGGTPLGTDIIPADGQETGSLSSLPKANGAMINGTGSGVNGVAVKEAGGDE